MESRLIELKETTDRKGVPAKIDTVLCINTSKMSTDEILSWVDMQMEVAYMLNDATNATDWAEVANAIRRFP